MEIDAEISQMTQETSNGLDKQKDTRISKDEISPWLNVSDSN